MAKPVELIGSDLFVVADESVFLLGTHPLFV